MSILQRVYGNFTVHIILLFCIFLISLVLLVLHYYPIIVLYEYYPAFFSVLTTSMLASCIILYHAMGQVDAKMKKLCDLSRELTYIYPSVQGVEVVDTLNTYADNTDMQRFVAHAFAGSIKSQDLLEKIIVRLCEEGFDESKIISIFRARLEIPFNLDFTRHLEAFVSTQAKNQVPGVLTEIPLDTFFRVFNICVRVGGVNRHGVRQFNAIGISMVHVLKKYCPANETLSDFVYSLFGDNFIQAYNVPMTGDDTAQFFAGIRTGLTEIAREAMITEDQVPVKAEDQVGEVDSGDVAENDVTHESEG